MSKMKKNEYALKIEFQDEELQDEGKISKEKALLYWGFESSVKKGDQYIFEVSRKKTTKNKILIYLRFKKITKAKAIT